MLPTSTKGGRGPQNDFKYLGEKTEKLEMKRQVLQPFTNFIPQKKINFPTKIIYFSQLSK